MRVVMVSWGSRGDVEPLAALALRMRELGADVRMCVPPDDDFAALARRAGVPLVPLGPAVRSVVAGDRPPGPDAARRMAVTLVTARYETLTTEAADCDLLVATGLMPAGVRSVAEYLGVRYAFACFQPYGLPSHHFTPPMFPGPQSPGEEIDYDALWAQEAQRVNGLYRETENAHRAALGLPPVPDVRAHVLTERPLLAADPLLCPMQGRTDLDLVQTGAWLLPDERPLPRDLVEFLDAGAPPVYVGFGSMAAILPADVGRVAVAAVRAQGRRVVLGSGWAGLGATDGTGDCHVVGEVNQQALFGRVAAVVHHGGAGTTTAAALAGAPQVIVPQIVDQPRWAARVAELGIGVAHDGPAPDVGSLSAALAAALTPETAARATRVAGEIRTDGAEVAARLLRDAVVRGTAPLPG